MSAPVTPNTPVQPAKEWRVIRDWRWILTKSHSARWHIAAAVLSGLEVLFTYFTDNPPMPRGAFGVLAFLTTIAAFGARFYAQREKS